MPKGFSPNFDLALVHAGTTIDLMLAEGEQGRKVYRDGRTPSLPPAMMVSEASYANYLPDVDLVIAAQDEFHAGMGALHHKHDKQYAESIGFDARIRGKVKLSPKVRDATVNTIAALATADFPNMDWETWTDATTPGTWTKTGLGAITNREGTVKQGGLYSCNLVSGADKPSILNPSFEAWTAGEPDNWVRISGNLNLDLTNINDGARSAKSTTTTVEYSQDLAWDDSYRGREVTFSLYSYSNGAGGTRRVEIHDGVGITNSTTVGRLGIWELTTVTRVLDVNATKLQIRVCGQAPNFRVYFDGPSTLTMKKVNNVSVYQDLSTWGSYYNNKEATFTCHVKTTLASNMRIGIDDGITTTWSAYDIGNNAWNQLSVTKTPAANGTRLRLIVERNSDIYASTDYIDTGTFTQAAAARGTPVMFLNRNNVWYYFENKTVFKLSGTTFTEIYTFPAVITDALVYKQWMFVAQGTADFYLWSADNTTWSIGTTTGHRMQYLASVGGTLWGNSSRYQIKSTIDPTNLSNQWTTATDIGDDSVVITKLIEYNNVIFVAKADNVYYVASGGTVHSIAPQFKGLLDNDNFKNAIVWDSLLLPMVKGLYGYYFGNFGILTNISLSKYAPAFGDYHGRVKALASDGVFIYVILAPTGSNTKSKVMSIRKELIRNVEVPSDWRWHSIQEVAIDDVKASGVFDDKLWIAGLQTGTAAVKYLSLADDDFPSNGLGVKVSWQKDGDTTWTELGGVGLGTFTTEGTKSFQVDTSGKRVRVRLSAIGDAAEFITPYYDANLRGVDKVMLVFELYGDTLDASTPTTTPEINAIVIRGVLAPKTLRVVDCVIKCEDGVIMKNGHPSDQLGSKLQTLLKAAAEETNPLTLYDIHGNSRLIKIKAPTPDEMPIADYQPNRVQTQIRLLMQEVASGGGGSGGGGSGEFPIL